MPRVLAIGDVHGCLDELQELLHQAEGQFDAIVFVGDLIDRGPKIIETVDFVYELSGRMDVTVIRGNHDDKFCRWAKQSIVHALENGKVPGIKAKNMPDWQVGSVQGRDEHSSSAPLLCSVLDDHNVRRAYEHIEEMTAETYYLKWGEFIFVHGGIPADWYDFPTSRGGMRQLMYTRHVNATTGRALSLGKQTDEDPYWASVYDGKFGHAIFGHQIHDLGDEDLMYEHATCLDTGCAFGVALTGIVVDTDTGERLNRVTVLATEEYARPRNWYSAKSGIQKAGDK